jgi:hypothetical protein
VLPAIIDELDPRGPLQEAMARDLAGLAWRQRRATTFEDLALGAVEEFGGQLSDGVAEDVFDADVLYAEQAEAALLEERARGPLSSPRWSRPPRTERFRSVRWCPAPPFGDAEVPVSEGARAVGPSLVAERPAHDAVPVAGREGARSPPHRKRPDESWGVPQRRSDLLSGSDIPDADSPVLASGRERVRIGAEREGAHHVGMAA